MRRDVFVLGLGAVLLDSAGALAGTRGHSSGARHHHAKLPKVIKDYIAAWRQTDGEAVAALLAEDGTYSDDRAVAMVGQTLIDYVGGFSSRHFRAVNVESDGDKFVIHWRVSHGRCGDAVSFRDEVVLSSGSARIASVRSLGYPPSDEVTAVLQEYVAGWTTYDGERSLATFAEAGVYYDPSNPDGIAGADLVAYIESLTWALIEGFYDLAVLKDGRIFGRWNLYLVETGQLLVQSYDLVTMQGNEILVVEGF